MKRKKIVVLGFMGGCPIAGVVWQHIHYIVGLQRLGHEVWYVEDGLRYPYDPEAYTITEDFSYAAKTLQKLAVNAESPGEQPPTVWNNWASGSASPTFVVAQLEIARRLATARAEVTALRLIWAVPTESRGSVAAA